MLNSEIHHRVSHLKRLNLNCAPFVFCKNRATIFSGCHLHIRFNNELRKTRTKLRHNEAPTELAVRNLINKFDKVTSICPRRGQLNENIAAVRQSVGEDPNTSIQCRAC